jgi:tripartite-type tricarboxylate transporter receptor subunit TctC
VTLGTVSGNVLAPLMLRPPPFDPVADLTPIALVATVPLVMTVPGSSPARDVAGFVAMLRANPGRLNFASNGPGTSQHLAAEMFMQATGTEMVHVPYRGSGPAMVDLIAGAVAVNFDTLSSVLPHMRQGTVRGLGVTTARRSAQAPELPTVAESGLPGFDIDVWYMLYGPPGLPQPVVARWAAAAGRALAEPEVRQRLGDAGFDVGRGSPADAASLVRAEVARYNELIRRANIRLD